MRALFLLAALSLGASGCLHVAAVPSVQGKSWFVKTTPFGGTFWNCDASGGEPTCYQVTETPLQAAK